MIRAICFDFDGTLVDSEVIHTNIWLEFLKHFNIKYTEEEFTDLYTGLPTPFVSEKLVDQYKLPMSPQEFTHEKVSFARKKLNQRAFPLQPHANELLQFAKQHYQISLVTGSGLNVISPTLKQNNWFELFEYIITADDVTNNKPYPDSYMLACKKMNVLPNESLAIEDSFTGYTAATNAGLKTILLPNTPSVTQKKITPLKMFNNLKELEEWLKNNL